MKSFDLQVALREVLETEERETVGKSFGGTGEGEKKYSLPKIRDFLLTTNSLNNDLVLDNTITKSKNIFRNHFSAYSYFIAAAIRFSFLIELTNLKLGSTKMKTRWLPGLILKGKGDSFESVPGEFSPGNDPRAATYESCVEIFCKILNSVPEDGSKEYIEVIEGLNRYSRVAYEFPVTYENPRRVPCHTAENTKIILPNSEEWKILQWLIKTRRILDSDAETGEIFKKIMRNKVEMKVYKTDRSLTGKDKTNRAKRWEALGEDYQYASLPDCWSVEKSLLVEMFSMKGFPESVKTKLSMSNLIDEKVLAARCLVTFDDLSFEVLSKDVTSPVHGKAEYQIGHKIPLKSGGIHAGNNVCWQTADGNRIQGNLSVQKTDELLSRIFKNRIDEYRRLFFEQKTGN